MNYRGYLLIEALIAMTIFAIGFMAIGKMIIFTTRNNTQANIITRTQTLRRLAERRVASFIVSYAEAMVESVVTRSQLADTTLILSGALPAAALAVVVDYLLGRVERLVRPPGVNLQSS